MAKGIVVVTEERALLWTDGRYHLQASKELDLDTWTLMPQGIAIIPLTLWTDSYGLGTEGILSPEEWLAANIAKGALIGFDPDQTSHERFLKYSKVCLSYGVKHVG